MDKSYRSLFIEICRTAQVLAEQVMDYDIKQKDEKGFATAQMMRDDYQKLEDTLKVDKELVYNDYAKLLAAAYIVTNNIQDRITNEQKVVQNYKTNIIPKLSRIMDEAKDNEELMKKLSAELLKVSEN
jgi:hypothetical protein